MRTDAEYLQAHAAWDRAPVLVCRNCGSENIRSVDEYVGTCAGEARAPGGVSGFEPAGYTEIAWDSCTQVGWDCGDCSASASLPAGTPKADPEALLKLLADFTRPSPEGAPT